MTQALSNRPAIDSTQYAKEFTVDPSVDVKALQQVVNDIIKLEAARQNNGVVPTHTVALQGGRTEEVGLLKLDGKPQERTYFLTNEALEILKQYPKAKEMLESLGAPRVAAGADGPQIAVDEAMLSTLQSIAANNGALMRDFTRDEKVARCDLKGVVAHDLKVHTEPGSAADQLIQANPDVFASMVAAQAFGMKATIDQYKGMHEQMMGIISRHTDAINKGQRLNVEGLQRELSAVIKDKITTVQAGVPQGANGFNTLTRISGPDSPVVAAFKQYAEAQAGLRAAMAKLTDPHERVDPQELAAATTAALAARKALTKATEGVSGTLVEGLNANIAMKRDNGTSAEVPIELELAKACAKDRSVGHVEKAKSIGG